MSLIALALFAQLAGTARTTRPVLAFPEPGLDDSAAYQGYQTRFFRDAAGNTIQIYLDGREGRVVHLWADAEDESLGFSARDAQGRPATLHWDGPSAIASRSARTRRLEYGLVAVGRELRLGWFLLGSMRVERDFQYAKRHRDAFGGPPFLLPEIARLLAALEQLDSAERQRHLVALGASSVDELRARLQPTISILDGGSRTITRIVQPSFDGRDTLALEIRTNPRLVEVVRAGDSLSLRARSGGRVPFTMRIATTGKALTPLTRREIFNSEFLDFLATARASAHPTRANTVRAQRMERQVRGLELLVSHEKLMAGLPAYATYFGRDMLMTALMMRPIWRDAMYEFVVASVLRKLSPQGQVSHEEAMGGQAVREAASEYAALIDGHLRAARTGNRADADSLLARARAVIGDLRRVRENYHMIDAEYQFPIVAARWLTDPTVSSARKRAFLLDSSDGGETRLRRLLRELALVSRTTAAYGRNPIAANLISFAPRDSGRWASQSWRDSNVGYAGGRYAMDVNAIWAPHALESVGRILQALRTIGLDSLARAESVLDASTPLGRYASDSVSLRQATDAWRGAGRHFVVQLEPRDVHSRVMARLAAMPDEERRYWTNVLARSTTGDSSLTFLALSLDAQGRPIVVANSDPATRLFLGDDEGRSRGPDGVTRANVLRDVRLFTRPYPSGLLIAGVGPVVANDAYASPEIWRDLERDRYHGPRVVWGREVNLFLLGVLQRIADAGDTPGNSGGRHATPELASYVQELLAALERVKAAVDASGFHSELWSYEVRDGRAIPVRYGTGSDIQLWSTTDLVVQFALSRLQR